MQHDFPFDPTYGYDQPSLLRITPPEAPSDLPAFWRQAYRKTLEAPLNLKLKPVPSPEPKFDLFEIAYDSWAGARIRGWFLRPRDVEIRRGLVVSHGYGGRQAPDFRIPGPPAAVIQPVARGLPISNQPPYPDVADRHVLHGIERRESYIHLGCAADVWTAASALLQLVPEAAGNLDYSGGSFGGGIGGLAVPWDSRFRRAFLDVPSFGNHPIRVQLPCVGSGESIRLLHGRDPKVMDVLRYFDSASTARFMRIPTLVAAALFDPAVPPPGQFSVFNALPDPKELFVRSGCHFQFPEREGEEEMLFQRLDAWFNEGMN